jgi:hypothetical protein
VAQRDADAAPADARLSVGTHTASAARNVLRIARSFCRIRDAGVELASH